MFLAIMVFPQAIAAHNHAVAGLGEEVQGESAFDQGAVDFLGPVPVEVGEGFKAAEAGLSQAAFGTAAGPGLGVGAGGYLPAVAGGTAVWGRPGGPRSPGFC